MRAAAVIAALVLGACGGSDVAHTTGGPLRDEPRPRPPAPRREVEPAPVAHPPGRPFAASPLTAFADAMTDLALAAVEGRPLPASPVPVRGDAGVSPVEWGRVARPRALSVLGLALEVELVLKRGEPADDAEGPARWGSIRATIVISRSGLRLVELRPRQMSTEARGGAPPPGMGGLPEVAARLLADLRRQDVSAWELGEDERRLLANDSVWAQVQEDRPRSARLAGVASLLADLPDAPLAYELDDVAVLARTEDGRLLSLTLELDPHDGSFALVTPPLVRVVQVWPR